MRSASSCCSRSIGIIASARAIICRGVRSGSGTGMALKDVISDTCVLRECAGVPKPTATVSAQSSALCRDLVTAPACVGLTLRGGLHDLQSTKERVGEVAADLLVEAGVLTQTAMCCCHCRMVCNVLRGELVLQRCQIIYRLGDGNEVEGDLSRLPLYSVLADRAGFGKLLVDDRSSSGVSTFVPGRPAVRLELQWGSQCGRARIRFSTGGRVGRTTLFQTSPRVEGGLG